MGTVLFYLIGLLHTRPGCHRFLSTPSRQRIRRASSSSKCFIGTKANDNQLLFKDHTSFDELRQTRKPSSSKAIGLMTRTSRFLRLPLSTAFSSMEKKFQRKELYMAVWQARQRNRLTQSLRFLRAFPSLRLGRSKTVCQNENLITMTQNGLVSLNLKISSGFNQC